MNSTILQPGDTLAGYTIEAIVGIGGMGIVYRARQVSLSRPVALKVLVSELADDERFRERFSREATQMAALEHPNVVPVYEADEADGRIFMAMRLIEGRTLADDIRKQRLTGERAFEILRAVADALEVAHRIPLIHRDVKPQNILLTNDGHPYLADFGVAYGTHSNRLTQTGGFLGSLHYASPEQLRGETVTTASDVYSLAAVMFECLTGRSPFGRDSHPAILQAHLTDPPPSIRGYGVDAPAALDDVFVRGLAKDPGKRTPHASELVAGAMRALRDTPAARMAAAPLFPVADAREVGSASHPTPVNVATESLGREGGHTLADLRRDVVESPPEPTPRRKPLQISLRRAALVAALMGATLIPLGFLLGQRDTMERSARSGPLEVTYAPPWTTAEISSRDSLGLTYRDPIGLRFGASGTAGTFRGGVVVAPPATDLVASVASRLSFADRRNVKLGAGPATRIDGVLAKRGGSLRMYVTLTSEGWAILECSSQAAMTAPFRSACDRLVGGVSLHGARTFPPYPDPVVAKRLGTLASELSSAHARATDGLTGSRGARARAAGSLSVRYRKVADRLRAVPASPRDRAAVLRLARAADRVGAAYGALAGAARANRRRGYERARRSVSAAEENLVRAVRGLRKLGYKTRTH
jgi:serine/threonine protein kinase